MLSAWVYLTAYPTVNARRVIGIGAPSSARVALEIDTSGRLRLEQRTSGGTLTALVGVASITQNQWVNIEAHRDSGGVTRLLIDGVVDVTTSTVIDMTSDPSVGCQVAGRSDTGNGLVNARLDEVIYLCGLTDHEGAFTPETAAYANPALPEVGIQTDPLALRSWAPTWPNPILLDGPIMLLRALIGGDGRIVGTVSIKGTPNVPVRRRVRLHREVDGVCVGERWSDAVTGAYEFFGFDRTITYTVLAYDGPRVFKATVADGVIPELIT
jgi:hypothetical protein